MFATNKAAANAAAEIKSLLKDSFSVRTNGRMSVDVVARRDCIHGIDINAIADYCRANNHDYYVAWYYGELTISIY